LKTKLKFDDHARDLQKSSDQKIEKTPKKLKKPKTQKHSKRRKNHSTHDRIQHT